MPAPEANTLGGLDLLLVEDEPLLARQIRSHLESLGAEVSLASTLEQARHLVDRLNFDLALIDVHLPDGKGTELLDSGKFAAHTGVVVMTADGGVTGAVEAMRRGALDYLVKPFEIEELPLVLQRVRQARQSARLREHHRQDPEHSGSSFHFSPRLQPLRAQLDKILAADQRIRQHLPPVLIEGETGTGKTTIARWLHHQGPRTDQPLVEMNCSALPENLAESELFGHERGAFTDARTARMGLFEAASGGTLFLDELPSLSLGLQAKVLKAVEDHKIRRLGGRRDIPVDVRIVAATHQPLRQRVEEGLFRADLFHRLDLYRLSLPPLRERPEDIPALAGQLLEGICRRHRLETRRIAPEGLRRLQACAWPGNVRELAHELERAVVFEEGASLTFSQLRSSAATGESPGPGDWWHPGFVLPEEGFDLEAAINQFIQRALDQSGGNVSAAARLLGVTRDYLRYRLSGSKSQNPDGE